MKHFYRLLVVCLLITASSCGGSGNVSEPHFIILNAPLRVDAGIPANFTLDLRNPGGYDDVTGGVTHVWVEMEGEGVSGESKRIQVTGPDPQIITVSITVPPDLNISSGAKTFQAYAGRGSYGINGNIISAEHPKLVDFYASDNSGTNYEISNILFGANDIGNNGVISDQRSYFPGSARKVHYRIEFTSVFPQRTKIRKTWYRNNEVLFSAIQIVEANDNAIWGVIKRRSGANLESGTYRFMIEEYKPNNEYETLNPNPEIDRIFVVQ